MPVFFYSKFVEIALMLSIRYFVLLFFALYFVVILQVPVQGHLGGGDFGSSQNVISSIVLSVLLGLALIDTSNRHKVKLTLFTLALVLIVFLAPINLIILGSFNDSFELYILGGVTALLVYLYTSNLRWRDKNSILFIIMLGATAQSIQGLLQVYLPQVNSIYPVSFNKEVIVPQGTFYQVNVFSSFITTGFAIACYFLCSKSITVSCASRKTLIVTSLLSIIFFSMAIALTGSRTGYLSTIVVALYFIFRYARNKRNYVSSILLALIVPLTITILSKPEHTIFSDVKLISDNNIETIESGEVASTENKSVIEDKLTRSYDLRSDIYKVTLAMLMDKPVTGYGYGKFLSPYIKYADKLDNSSQGLQVTHPHNFLLYIWSNAGIYSLVVVILAGLYALKVVVNKDRNLTIFVLMLPILIHSMLELPFSQSVVHIVVISMLIGMLSCRFCTIKLPKKLCVFASLPVFIIAISMTYFFFGVLSYNKLLISFDSIPVSVTKVNTATLLNRYPATQFANRFRTEVRYYNAVFYRLVNTSDRKLAYHYMQWAKKIIKDKPDDVIYYNLVYCYLILGDLNQARDYWLQTKKYFPNSTPYPALSNVMSSMKVDFQD